MPSRLDRISPASRPSSVTIAPGSRLGPPIRTRYSRFLIRPRYFRRDGDLRMLADADLRPQPVQQKAALQIGEPRRFGIDPDRLAVLDHDEIVQVFALGGQQRGINGAIGGDLLDSVRDEPLQKAAPIGSGDGENAAILKNNKARFRHGANI